MSLPDRVDTERIKKAVREILLAVGEDAAQVVTGQDVRAGQLGARPRRLAGPGDAGEDDHSAGGEAGEHRVEHEKIRATVSPSGPVRSRARRPRAAA